MPDTNQEKEQGFNSCYNCKYTAVCELFKEWKRLSALTCKLGVK